MKKIIFSLTVFVSLFLAAGPSRLFGEVIDKIAIVVNDEIITQSEIDRLVAPIYERYRTLYQDDELVVKLEEARQRVIQQLIEDRLVLGEAKKFNVEVDEREVEEKVDAAVKRFESRQMFEEALAQERITLKDLKSRYREQLMAKRLVDQKVGSRITVTPVEINEYYAKHTEEFAQPEELKLRNILIKPIPDPKKALELAREITRRLKEGGDFAGLAKIYSEGPGAAEGGLMGYVKRGDLMPQIERIVFGLKEGETSHILQTSLGYHIFKLEERRQSKTLSLPEVRRDVEEAVYREKIREKIKGWVESLKKNAYIAFK